MDKNIKEIFAVNAFMILAMAISAIAGFYTVGCICASAVVSFVMLRGRMRDVIVSIILVFSIDSVLNLAFSYTAGIIVCVSALCINLAVRSRGGLLRVTAAGALGTALALIICFSAAEALNNGGMKIADVKEFFNLLMDSSINLLNELGYFNGYTSEEITFMKNFSGMVVIPFVIIAGITLYSYFSVAVLKKLMRRAKCGLCAGIADFSAIRADKMCLAIAALSYAVYAFFINSNYVVGAASFCMFIILTVFYYVCGISVISFFAKRSRGGQKVLFVVFMIFMALFLVYGAALIGIIDSFVDIRKLGKGAYNNER